MQAPVRVTTRRTGLTLLAALFAPLCAHAQADTRAPTAAEQARFSVFYRAAYPLASSVPAVVASRAQPQLPWQLSAVLDGPPTRAAQTLCRMQRTTFSLARRWQADPAPRQLVWLQAGACAVPAQPVELLQRMADVDVVPLLTRAPQLLPHARLIMAGASSCASARSFPFALAAIDVAPLPGAVEEMPTLVFRSERGVTARLWVRKGPGGLDAWNVSCTGAPV